ncbi:hypothetical protein M758_10G158900 [Ceratodon purpureus]|nr:hypothetical protein M758_10G158900 [Ceratodon purpureus]
MRSDGFVEMEVGGRGRSESGSEGGGEVTVPPLWLWLATQSSDVEQRVRSSVDGCGEVVRRMWGKRPRDAKGCCTLARRNLVTAVVVLLSGIITWEMSVDSLRARVNYSIVFPVYLPHAVTLSMASVWRLSVAPGNVIGLYLARMYMAGRGQGFTSVNTTIIFLVCMIASTQSHVAAYYLWKCLCKGREKKLPTIDSVADAVWYLVIISLSSLLFSTLVALCVTLSPLVKWQCFWQFWSTWWLGVLGAMVTVSPLIIHLIAWRPSPSLKRPGKIIEILFTAAVTVSVVSVVFIFDLHTFRPMPYLCVPLITYTAFRFNRVGWAFTVTAIALFSASGSIRGRGAVHVLSDRPVPWSANLLLQVELFSIVMGVVSISLAAAVRENKNLTRKLHQMNVELECTVDSRTMELRKTNEELQISQKHAEMASHAKSDFLANMSHEIRTPIHGILGLTALLLESDLSSDQEESLVSVKECADLLLHIINSVLDLAKIEAGRLEVERVPFNIRKMVSSTFRMMEARAHERDLKLLWEVDREVPHFLVGDVGKLQQCLLNLVGNALKFTHEGSISVHIRVASESLQASMMNAHDGPSSKVAVAMPDTMSLDKPAVAPTPESMLIHFEVRDTGIGINKEKLKDMFKPFTQADASTSRLYGGTGLGLCIVHRFVELLDGSIWVESEVGKGSTFHFCLPLSFSTSTPKGDSAQASPGLMSPGNVYLKQDSCTDGLALDHIGLEYINGAIEKSDSGSQCETSTDASRAQSTSDLQDMWKGSTNSVVISIDDLSAQLLGEKGKYSLTINNGNIRPCAPGSAQRFILDGDSCNRERRASGSDYEEYIESERANRYKFDHGNSSARPSPYHGLPRWHCRAGDRSASNDVATPTPEKSPTGLLPKSDMLGLAPLQRKALSPLKPTRQTGGREGTLISRLTCEEDLVRASLDAQGTDVASIRLQSSSEPTRDFPAEMEKVLLENKLQLKILLAEDNPINQKIASRQLQKHGHVVTIVGDGQQALNAMCAQHDNFDLVLMDVQMPIMDGLFATEQIRKAEIEKGWSRVPVLGLTAHAIQGYHETCLAHGMDGYLGKPFDIQQLLKTIGHLLPREKLGQ